MNTLLNARYVLLANHLRSEIEQGLWAPGQRLPSVRQLSHIRSVSVTTVLAAYRRLEDLQLIESKPKLGYFVAAPSSNESLAGVTDNNSPSPAHGYSLNRRTDQSPSTSFGAAVCCDSFFPTRAVARYMATAIRSDQAILSRPSSHLGSDRLRRSLAAHASTWNCHLDQKDILVTNGCVEALSLALRALTRPGDTVLVDSPTYFGYLSTLAQLQLVPDPLPFTSAPADAIRMIGSASRGGRVAACVLSTSVINPSGISMSEQAKLSLVETLEAHSIPLIEDATFSDLHFDATQRVAKSYDQTGNVVLCASTSKTLLPGMRLGWVSGGRHHESIVSMKGNSSATPALVVQNAIGDFLQGGGYQHHLRRFRRRAKAHVAETLEFIEQNFPEGTRARFPDGGYLLWVALPPAQSATELAMRASSEGIRLAPGPMFSPIGEFRNYLRVNCGYPLDNARQSVLKRVAEIASEFSDLYM